MKRVKKYCVIHKKKETDVIEWIHRKTGGIDLEVQNALANRIDTAGRSCG